MVLRLRHQNPGHSFGSFAQRMKCDNWHSSHCNGMTRQPHKKVFLKDCLVMDEKVDCWTRSVEKKCAEQNEIVLMTIEGWFIWNAVILVHLHRSKFLQSYELWIQWRKSQQERKKYSFELRVDKPNGTVYSSFTVFTQADSHHWSPSSPLQLRKMAWSETATIKQNIQTLGHSNSSQTSTSASLANASSTVSVWHCTCLFSMWHITPLLPEIDAEIRVYVRYRNVSESERERVRKVYSFDIKWKCLYGLVELIT